MRVTLAVVCLASLLLGGCSSTQAPGHPARNDTPLNASKAGPSHAITIRPARVLNGRIVIVNGEAGVCVVNFPIGQLPPLDATLTVYRHGIRTGEIKVTGPTRDDNIAAEILIGDIQADDEARDH